MGKASLALDITRHVAVELHTPVVFSLEMRADELGLKLLSSESDIAARCARAGQLEQRRLDVALITPRLKELAVPATSFPGQPRAHAEKRPAPPARRSCRVRRHR